MTVRDRRRPGRMLIAAAAMCTVGTAGTCAAAEEPPPVYKHPEAPVEARIDDLPARMTLEEKVAQLLTSVKATARVARRLEQN